MPKQPSDGTRRYDAALDLLARECLLEHKDASTYDVADALMTVIARSLPKAIHPINLAIEVVTASEWPNQQSQADTFIGRYVREIHVLSAAARKRGLKGFAPIEREVIDAHFPPRRQDDFVLHQEMKQLRKVLSYNEICIGLIDAAYDEESPLFASPRDIISSANPLKIIAYISSWVRYMVASGHDDIIIAQRLKLALSTPRTATLHALNKTDERPSS